MHRRQLFHQTDRNIDSSAIANTKQWVNDLFLQISIQAAVRNWSTGEAVSGTSYMPTGKQEKAHHKTGTGGSSICLGQPSVISRYFSPSSTWIVRQASKSWQHEVIKGWIMQIQTRVSGTKEVALHGELIRCMRGNNEAHPHSEYSIQYKTMKHFEPERRAQNQLLNRTIV